METPEAPHQHHSAHTGRSWLDMTLGLSAMFVSIMSLVLAIEHGRTMERMADANTRMVEANSWPFVEFDSHDVDEQGKDLIRLVLTNVGIGPARIATFELSFDGKPMASLWELLQACCGATPDAPQKWNQIAKTRIAIGNVAPNILRPGDHENFVTMTFSPDNLDLMRSFDSQRGKITTRTCYCSVFDECWISSGLAIRAEPISSCPTPAISFRTDVRAPQKQKQP